jgi:hypothetical protein
MREGCGRLLGAPLALLLSPFFKRVYLRDGDGDLAGDGLRVLTCWKALEVYFQMSPERHSGSYGVAQNL